MSKTSPSERIDRVLEKGVSGLTHLAAGFGVFLIFLGAHSCETAAIGAGLAAVAVGLRFMVIREKARSAL